MSLFHWQALTPAGEPRQGALAGESEVQVVDLLRRQGLRVTAVRRESPIVELPRVHAATSTVIAVLRELLALRSVGLGSPAALARLAGVHEAEALGGELALVRRAVEAGQPLGEALARVPQRFDALVCQVLAAGEAHGELDAALRRLVDHLELSARPTALAVGLRRIALTLVIAVIAGGCLLGVLAPAAAGLYARLDVPLSATAAGLLRRGVAVQPALRWLAVAAALLALAAAGASRTPRLRAHVEALALRVPLLGPALRAHGAVRLARLLALLLAAPVPLLAALELAAPRLGNHALGVALLRARSHVAQGVDLASALADAHLLPPLALELLRAAESGARATALPALVGLCEAQADAQARRAHQLARIVRAAVTLLIVIGLLVLLGPLRG